MSAASPLLTAPEIRRLAESGGIRPTKQKGQNFLLDPNTVRGIVERARIAPGQAVVEVGPGLGSLTLGLLDAGVHLGCIELDEKLADLLPQTVAAKGFDPDSFALTQGDALKVEQLPRPAAASSDATALVANLPYNVATPIVLTMFARFDSLRSALVMVQKEVAERLAAVPGSKIYGAPSVKTAWYGSAELAGTISRQVFWPVPNVDSALVRIQRDRVADPAEPAREDVFRLIDAAFAQRRKTLRSALKPALGTTQVVDAALGAAGIEPTRRGETLVISDFIRLAAAASGLR